jgi:beta-galactosidase
MQPHAGAETRTYREVEMLGADLAALGDLPAPGGEARVGIVLDWPNAWAIDQPDHPAQFDYLAQVRGWHAAFHELNVQVDLVGPDGPFDAYELVVAPSLYLIRDATALNAFVERGGRLLMTAFSDVVDEYDRLLPGGFTRRLGAALGLAVLDIAGALPGEAPVTWEGGTFDGDVLAEVVRLDGAEVLGRFGTGDPAVTRHTYGTGEAYYVATLPDATGRAALVRHLVARAGIEPVLTGLPPRVEACARGGMITLINHNPFPVAAGDAVLGPFGYRMTTTS